MMKRLELVYKDNKDLLLLFIALNNVQCSGRRDLALHCSKSKKMETVWFDETVDEWSRIQSLKVQVAKVLER